MKLFWRSLKNHPGVGIAFIFTLAGGFAGIHHGGLRGFIGGALFMGLLCWAPVLITAWTGRHDYKHEEVK